MRSLEPIHFEQWLCSTSNCCSLLCFWLWFISYCSTHYFMRSLLPYCVSSNLSRFYCTLRHCYNFHTLRFISFHCNIVVSSRFRNLSFNLTVVLFHGLLFWILVKSLCPRRSLCYTCDYFSLVPFFNFIWTSIWRHVNVPELCRLVCANVKFRYFKWFLRRSQGAHVRCMMQFWLPVFVHASSLHSCKDKDDVVFLLVYFGTTHEISNSK